MKLPDIQKFYTVIAHLSKREKLIFYIAVIVVCFLLLDKMIIYPIYSHIRNLDQQIKDKETAIRKDLKVLAQKDRIELERAKYASFTNAPKSEEEAMTGILKEIEGLAGKASVYLIDMKPGGVKDMGVSKKYTVTLNCEGKMEQITDFIYNIENSRKLLRVERCQINPKSKESSVAQCSMSVSQIVIP